MQILDHLADGYGVFVNFQNWPRARSVQNLLEGLDQVDDIGSQLRFGAFGVHEFAYRRIAQHRVFNLLFLQEHLRRRFEFLLRFGLKDINELPSMEEFEKLLAASFQSDLLPSEITPAEEPESLTSDSSAGISEIETAGEVDKTTQPPLETKEDGQEETESRAAVNRE